MRQRAPKEENLSHEEAELYLGMSERTVGVLVISETTNSLYWRWLVNRKMEGEFHSGKLRQGETSKTTDHTAANWMALKA